MKLILLTTASALLVIACLVAALQEHRRQRDLVAFDLLRAAVLGASLWLTVGLAALAAPGLFTPVEFPSWLFLLAMAVGGLGFVWFRLQAGWGWHPWQRSDEGDRAGR